MCLLEFKDGFTFALVFSEKIQGEDRDDNCEKEEAKLADLTNPKFEVSV